jgi:DNA primase
LWRISPAPVLCFDGDAAGGRAAARAAELVLPMLAPDRTLRLATLPAGEDPDTLVRNSGPGAFQSLLENARPLSTALYDLLREGQGDATPEQRAAFRTRLEEAARRIPDRALSSEYRRALLDRFFASRPAQRGFKGGAVPASPRPRRVNEGGSWWRSCCCIPVFCTMSRIRFAGWTCRRRSTGSVPPCWIGGIACMMRRPSMWRTGLKCLTPRR